MIKERVYGIQYKINDETSIEDMVRGFRSALRSGFRKGQFHAGHRVHLTIVDGIIRYLGDGKFVLEPESLRKEGVS